MNIRRSGVLLHITSLPSVFGIGDLGPEAYRFADFLAEAGQRVWQILPLNPTISICGNSPYCSYSAFSENPLLISPELLARDGLLSSSDLDDRPAFPVDRVDYERVIEYKTRLLARAFERFKTMGARDRELDTFCSENAHWLDDSTLFAALKEQSGGMAWNEWSPDLRDRAEGPLQEWKDRLADRILAEKFLQYLFYRQWSSLKKYCNGKNIQIMGDVPIYVSYDSADVWANPHLFRLDNERNPLFVAGVPPDYFSATGQRWGNPLYDWERLAETGYAWWVRRLECNMKLFDLIRLDHFRGFVAYWEIPSSEQTAMNGKWVEAPAVDFFNTLLKHFPSLPIIAEDLGIITLDVKQVMKAYGFPGMKLLLFAFGDDKPTNPYLPHNHVRNSVVYTGTHDNNTVRGWYRIEAGQEEKARVARYVGRPVDEERVHWEFLRLAMMSVANLAVIPIQDILGVGEEGRMNTPAVTYGNWSWRLAPGRISRSLTDNLLEVTRFYGRA